MITRVEALNYRCLKHVEQPLGPFHVLVGPNGSGKSSFLDVLAFLGRLIGDGLDAAIEERTSNFHDLYWGRQGDRLELAVEAKLPEERQPPLEDPSWDGIRYEIAIGPEEDSGHVRILEEQVRLLNVEGIGASYRPSAAFKSVLLSNDGPPRESGTRPLIHRFTSKDSYHVSPENPVAPEGSEREALDYTLVLKRNTNRSVLTILHEDEFPGTDWLASRLKAGLYKVCLDNARLRNPSPPGKGLQLLEDGSNLPWIVSKLQEKHAERLNDWLAHVRTALPDLEGIRVIERPEDRHRYLMLQYPGGLEVPSWMLSDGTLRLLALTILPYDPDFDRICLVEEPENSIHPLNLEIVMQSLSSVYRGQVLVATHSPAILACTKLEEVLVFQRDPENGTTITKGSEHAALADWRGQPNLGVLFASGVLG